MKADQHKEKKKSNPLLLDIGQKVKKAREKKGLTQTVLAYKIDKDQPSINRLETGNINPSYLYLLEVCAGLEISLSELLEL